MYALRNNNLNTITISCLEPPTITETSFYFYMFNNVNSGVLKVPSQSIELYKNAPVWKDFNNIVAIED